MKKDDRWWKELEDERPWEALENARPRAVLEKENFFRSRIYVRGLLAPIRGQSLREYRKYLLKSILIYLLAIICATVIMVRFF